MIEHLSFSQRLARWIENWGVWIKPFYRGEIDEAMHEPGGIYITAFCQHCRRRIRHKLWFKRVTGSPIYLRYAYCMLCGKSWRYRGRRLSARQNLR